jgi:hypothetical protein
LFNTALEFIKLVYQDSVPAFGAAVVFQWNGIAARSQLDLERRGERGIAPLQPAESCGPRALTEGGIAWKRDCGAESCGPAPQSPVARSCGPDL